MWDLIHLLPHCTHIPLINSRFVPSSHLGKPIFSLDIHPDGTRFATGGQGVDSGRVTIWNLGPLMYQDYEKNENIPKMLCQLDNHLSCVNCVRWNHSGKFLGKLLHMSSCSQILN